MSNTPILYVDVIIGIGMKRRFLYRNTKGMFSLVSGTPGCVKINSTRWVLSVKVNYFLLALIKGKSTHTQNGGTTVRGELFPA